MSSNGFCDNPLNQTIIVVKKGANVATGPNYEQDNLIS